MAVNAGELVRELEELIAALDRRVPRVEQAGESAIARDAAALRAKAFDRLAQLAATSAVGAGAGQRRSNRNAGGKDAKDPLPGKSL